MSDSADREPDDKVTKSNDEWKASLTPEQFVVTRLKGTEPAFSGEYVDCRADGVYRCVCCGNELFRSGDKYDSGSGWPSFTQPIDRSNVRPEHDDSFGMPRVEVVCNRCDAHLGHVFDDGPREVSGLRFCINSAALDLDRDDETAK